jgi:homocysteine S-methyltransferase
VERRGVTDEGSPFARFMSAQGFVILDGGLATTLESAGHYLDTPLWSAGLLREAPQAIGAVHAAFLEAGADCVTTASYQASFEGFAAAGLPPGEAETLLRRSVELAREACDSFWAERSNRRGRLEPIVAASAGPYGAYLADGSEYDGRSAVGHETLAEFHWRRLRVLADTGADLVAFETIPSLPEAEVIGALLEEFPDTWAWVTFSCRDAGHLWDGSALESAVQAVLMAPRLAGVGVNCTAPRHVPRLIEAVRSMTGLPIVVYPNSGEHYDVMSRNWAGKHDTEDWLDGASEWFELGARVIGGCCRVGPLTIRRLRGQLAHAVRERSLDTGAKRKPGA